ncbi:MAG: tRNA (adenosine(37)-N6)-dimethylallyltransferase MiaA [Phycisphaeraceae bacterium]|nr:tRNA (adenosine(37)-N6)-dimethylallyltransferase MiaA [Phycisphaeraceae bacterium]
MPELRPILVLGPTAGGKSAVAYELARRLGAAEIVGADSMQIYRGMDAGTAKPDPAWRRQVVHHMIDVVEPTERFTVADWLGRAGAIIDGLLERRVVPIVVGGTNLYIQALLEGLFDGPPADPAIRDELERLDGPQLYAGLRDVDPAAADQIHPNDRRRLVRALEVHRTTGTPISAWQQQWRDDAADRPYLRDPRIIGLSWPTEPLNLRINLRVRAMFHPDRVPDEVARAVLPAGESLPDETRRLLDAGRLGDQSRQALGYKQVIEFIEGRMTLDTAFERTKILTRRFAKMQRTWLRRFRSVSWLDAAIEGPDALAGEAELIVRQ